VAAVTVPDDVPASIEVAHRIMHALHDGSSSREAHAPVAPPPAAAAAPPPADALHDARNGRTTEVHV